MNFQYIKKIERSQAILDIAFNSARKSAEIEWDAKKRYNKITRLKHSEVKRVSASKRIILKRLDSVVEQFPIIDNLPEIYEELIKNSIDFEKYKKSIHSVRWASGKIDNLGKESEKEIKRSEAQNEITSARKAFYARASSILKRIDKYLQFLEETRKTLKRLPDLKEDYFTVAIAGFPNVGKSSILKRLTLSSPEIAEYPFTTKGLNVGLIKNEKLQFVDVPGTLNRKKANIIEKNAHIIIKNADLVLFVIDPSGYSGYNIEKQLKLLEKIEKNKLVILNKCDLADKKTVHELTGKFNAEEISALENKGIDKLKKIILNEKNKRLELSSF